MSGTKSAKSESQAQSTKSTQSSIKSCPISDYVETLVIIAPDGGWGWLILLAAFCFDFVTLGTMYSFEICFSEIVEYYNATNTQVSVANSLMVGSYYLSGPVASCLINRYGIRAICLTGGLTAATAISVSSLMKSLNGFVFIYGFFGGFGFCMCQIASLVALGMYFNKWRALTTSLAVCGAPIGVTTYPIVATIFMTSMQWQSKFQIYALMVLIVTPLGLLYKPLKPRRVITQERKVMFQEPDGKVPSSEETIIFKPNISSKLFSFHNLNYPTTAELFDDRSAVLLEDSEEDVDHKDSLLNMAALSSSDSSSLRTLKSYRSRQSRQSFHIEFKEDQTEMVYQRERVPKTIWGWIKLKLIKNCCKYNKFATRPMYRDDIFFTGAIGIPITDSDKSAATLQYHLSVTRAATTKDLEDTRCWVCCPESAKRILATMLDVSILKSVSFVLMALSGFFFLLALYTPLVYMKQRAIQQGMDPEIAPFLLSCLGVACTLGGIMYGVLSVTYRNPINITWISLLSAGIVTILSSHSFEKSAQFSYAFIFGLAMAAYPALKAIILVEIFGIEKLTNALGILMVFHGVASLLGLPISGMIAEYTGNYNNCFYFAGSSLVLSALLLAPVRPN